jgi:magnesium transporter
MRREILSGVALGVALGVFGFVGVLFWASLGVADTGVPVRVALAVGLAIVGIVVWAVLLGSMLPLALQKLGFDPATLSSPMVATMMDVSGLLIYMGVALSLLRGTVL